MKGAYYGDGGNLRDKNRLATARGVDFAGWVIDQLDLQGVKHVLDAGTGWGRFALPLLERSPQLRLVCSDLSIGMLGTCRETLDGYSAVFLTADVTALPIADSAFDLAMANHML